MEMESRGMCHRGDERLQPSEGLFENEGVGVAANFAVGKLPDQAIPCATPQPVGPGTWELSLGWLRLSDAI